MKPGGARIVAVLGMHRSGTSLITRALEVLGVSLGDRLMAPSEGNNAKGFFEDVDINELNISLLAAVGSDWNSVRPLGPDDFERLYRDGWVERAIALLRQKCGDAGVFGFKDPRTAKLLPFWQEVFRRGEFAVKYLLALRNPASVADSLAARDGLPRERSYYLWLEHVLNSLCGATGSAPVLVNYDDFFGDAGRVLDVMAKGLGLSVDGAALEVFRDGFIDNELRHTLHGAGDLAADPGCPPLVAEVYQALLALPQGSLVDPALLARWCAEFERTRPALALADAGLRAGAGAAHVAALEILRAVARANPGALEAGFDRDWYAAAYPDVITAGLDPYRHYSQTGVFEGRHPGQDMVQASQRVLAALAGPGGAGERHWDELAALQRAAGEREARLAADVQLLTRQLHDAQQRHLDREAQLSALDHEARQQAQREREAAAQAGAAQLEQAGAQARQAEAEIRRLMAEATAREAAHAAAIAALQQEQAGRMAELARMADQRDREHLQQFADARDRAEAALRQLGEAEARWQQRAHATELERIREAAAQAAAAGETAALAAELAAVRARLAGIEGSAGWRAWALVSGRRHKRNE